MTITITFPQDQDATSPREHDNLGTMSCRMHRRYSLGDEQFPGSLEDFVAKLPKGSVVVPLYLYDHGNISVSATPFGDRWDSAELGVIWVSPKKLREEYGKADAASRAKALSVLHAEVQTYDQYVKGEVYGVSIDRDGEEEAVWGFFGDNVFENGMSEQFSDDELPALLQAAQVKGMSGTAEQMHAELAARLAHRTHQAKASARPRRV